MSRKTRRIDKKGLTAPFYGQMKFPDLRDPVGRLLGAGMLEGISFLLLLGIAVPLKHIWHMPEAVRIFGMAHGALFLLFLFTVFQAWGDRSITGKEARLAFLASLIPFAPFFLHRRLKERKSGREES
jgi:integral membrane protein